MSECQRCGACCAAFRVDFATDELQANGGHVPDGLADELNGALARLKGTDHRSPRCLALSGQVGHRVACGIYEWRPSPCREFSEGTDACTRARALKGLPTL